MYYLIDGYLWRVTTWWLEMNDMIIDFLLKFYMEKNIFACFFGSELHFFLLFGPRLRLTEAVVGGDNKHGPLPRLKSDGDGTMVWDDPLLDRERRGKFWRHYATSSLHTPRPP